MRALRVQSYQMVTQRTDSDKRPVFGADRTPNTKRLSGVRIAMLNIPVRDVQHRGQT